MLSNPRHSQLEEWEISDRVELAQELLTRVETECAMVGLRLNAKNTEVIAYNILPDHSPLITTEGIALKAVNDFKYLGSWVNSSEQDLNARKALAWRALNGMACVWKSNLPRNIKLSFFHATVESVLLYGCETWTLKPTPECSAQYLTSTRTCMLPTSICMVGYQG